MSAKTSMRACPSITLATLQIGQQSAAHNSTCEMSPSKARTLEKIAFYKMEVL
jgi:hypothetical protein